MSPLPSPTGRRGLAVALGMALVAACSALRPPPEAHEPLAPAGARTLPRPPATIARLLESERFVLRDLSRAESGIMGVSKATARFPEERLDLQVKWAPAPQGTLDAWNASPRKELAAYEIQRWFLDPDEWVVPPTAIRCVPLAEYPAGPEPPEATVAETRCVLGLVAAWLQHVRPVEPIYDPERFARDPAYAAHLADFNLLLHLIEHRDARSSNVLFTEDGRHVYSVDNGIAFGNLVYNYLVTNFDTIRVPALRRASIARLRRVTPRDLDALLVVRELRADRRGMLRRVAPGRPLDPAAGVRVRRGRVQLGLTRAEVDGVADRLARVLARVDAGEIRTF